MDAGVSRVVSLIEEYYSHDARTAYVLTSDHGMTNWGKIADLWETYRQTGVR